MYLIRRAEFWCVLHRPYMPCSHQRTMEWLNHGKMQINGKEQPGFSQSKVHTPFVIHLQSAPSSL